MVFYVLLAYIAFIGLCLGSFATALAWRLPRGESVLYADKDKKDGKFSRSRCPSCKNDLAVRDLVPVFSWLYYRGKCRQCGAKIGARYPLIELACGALCVAFALRFGITPPLAALMMLAPAIVAIIAIDLEHYIIPDALNITLAVTGVLAFALAAPGAPDVSAYFTAHAPQMAIGAAIYGGVAWGLRAAFGWLMKREPLGLGDVKFFAAAGLWLGFELFPAFLMLSGIGGIVLGLIWRVATGSREFPFGPALVLAFTICLLWRGGIFLALS